VNQVAGEPIADGRWTPGANVLNSHKLDFKIVEAVLTKQSISKYFQQLATAPVETAFDRQTNDFRVSYIEPSS